MSLHLTKFQQLLRELFQFDCADLDFGIYRIMNYKRDIIERFIAQDLPQAMSKELERGALAKQARAAGELEAAKKKVLEINDDAIDPSGTLVKYHDTKPGKEYLAAQERARSARDHEAMGIAVYNHLYAFSIVIGRMATLSPSALLKHTLRYPLQWRGSDATANHDQYYIKTGEYFTDYTWKAQNGVTVHFKLTDADVEQNNVKGEKRFFLPRLDEIVWNETVKSLTIPFEFGLR